MSEILVEVRRGGVVEGVHRGHAVVLAPDGTIEAVEHGTARWVVGVQWHPEDTAGSDHANQGLFAALVDAARG